GAGWGDSLLAHEGQLYPVPDDLSDEAAVLLEPAACALHAVLRHVPDRNTTVLVVGAGTIGLLTIMALKFLQPDCDVSVIARHPFQAELARRVGADRVILT